MWGIKRLGVAVVCAKAKRGRENERKNDLDNGKWKKEDSRKREKMENRREKKEIYAHP